MIPSVNVHGMCMMCLALGAIQKAREGPWHPAVRNVVWEDRWQTCVQYKHKIRAGWSGKEQNGVFTHEVIKEVLLKKLLKYLRTENKQSREWIGRTRAWYREMGSIFIGTELLILCQLGHQLFPFIPPLPKEGTVFLGDNWGSEWSN